MTAAAIEITYDGISSADIPELYIESIGRQITPEVRDVYVDVPGRAGSWTFPEEAGDRSLGASIAIVGDTYADRRAAVRKAARWLWKEGARRKLIISDEPDRFTWAKLSGALSSAEALSLGRFDVEWRTAPFDEETTVTTANLVGSDTVTVTATDDLADYILPSIQVTAGAGGLPGGFTLTIGARSIVYASAITAGSSVTVSSISSTVTTGVDGDVELDGSYTPANLAMTSVSGAFPRLVAGANALTITGVDTIVAVRYRRRFI